MVTLGALNAFRTATAWADNTKLNLDEQGGVSNAGNYGGFLSARNREQTERDANNAVRTELLKALARTFDLHVQCSRDYLAYKRIPKTQSCRFERKTSGLKIARSEKGEPIIEKTTPEFKEKRDMLLAAAKHGAVLISPYQTAEKRMTRFDACALNRIAQLIAGDGAADINYHGMKPTDIDRLVSEAVKGGFDGQHGDFWFSTEKSVTFRRVACKQSRDNFNKSENKGTEQ